jgi:hypothetical protein
MLILDSETLCLQSTNGNREREEEVEKDLSRVCVMDCLDGKMNPGLWYVSSGQEISNERRLSFEEETVTLT